MKYELEAIWALLATALLVLINKLPSGRARTALSTMFTAIIIIIIVIAGIAVVVELVLVPGTTSSYP